MFFKIIKKEFEIAGRNYFIETGKLALQADGSVVIGSGDARVLCTVVYDKKAKSDATFFPLSVHYMERFSALGKIPGGFVKRETKPTERETLISRLIDRPIRPLFPESFCNEVQVICTLLSYDSEVEVDILSLIGASAAIRLAGLPILQTVAACKIALINDQFVVNPSYAQLISKENKLDLTVAGTKTSILMVESEAHELTEDKMLEALSLAKKSLLPAIEAIESLSSEYGNRSISIPPESDIVKNIKSRIEKEFSDEFSKVYVISDKKERYSKLDEIRSKIKDIYKSELESGEIYNSLLDSAISFVEGKIVRHNVLDREIRIDGRKTDEVRPLYVETGILPKVHGSALFMRGETQALVSTTLGTPTEGQMHEDATGTARDVFMLNYNFPSFAVNEISQPRGPGRREIGHGKLALKAIRPMLDLENPDYAIRVVSDIVSCNGSSSMATVCGTSLSLMHAGIKIKKQIAGIAMGLIKEGDKYKILTDIMADEDHLGDMDFKVAGSSDGITALQMDIKIDGVSEEIMKKALEQAKKARLEILEVMNKEISQCSSSVNPNAPQIIKFSIPVNHIGDVIGKGGSNIKQLCEDYKCKIDISDDGSLSIYATDLELGNKAREEIMLMVTDLQYGSIYEGVVSEIKQFGAMIKLPGNKTGMVHISEIANERVNDVNDYFSVGDKVKVKYIGCDEKRRVKVSTKENPPKCKNNHKHSRENESEIIDKRISSESGVDILDLNSSNIYSN